MPWGPSDSAQNAFAVTPSNTTVFPQIAVQGGAQATKAIYVGTGGNLVVTMAGQTITFTAVPSGALLPLAVTQVQSTNTTASNIVGLY